MLGRGLYHKVGSGVGKLRYRMEETQRQWQKDWRAFVRRSHSQGMVLMYHRVAEKDIDPWSLCVTPENFERHLQVLKRHTQPMSLRALAIAKRQGTLPDRAVAITFDDGYANNLYQAKPLLARYGIPATVFVSTGYTEREREFWWDELERVLLAPGTLPPVLELKISHQLYRWEISTARQYSEADYRADCDLVAWQAKPGSRLHFYHQVWATLQPLTEAQRLTALDAIIDWSGAVRRQRETHRPMRREELRQLEGAGEASLENRVVSIGAHTVHHSILLKHSLDWQQEEIEASRAYLEQLLDHAVDTFAYPFGAYCPETVPLLNQADFLCACTTQEETLWKGTSPYELPRFDVGNWSADVFETNILDWFRRGYRDYGA